MPDSKTSDGAPCLSPGCSFGGQTNVAHESPACKRWVEVAREKTKGRAEATSERLERPFFSSTPLGSLRKPAAEAVSVEYPCDPSLPCPFPPGSPQKLACLCLRRERRLPLWVNGDALGARQLCYAEPSAVSKRTQLERRILLAASDEPLPARALAERSGARWTSSFRRVLAGLHEAGVLLYDRRAGWRLARI
jgi:hypothetical protein